MKFWLVLLGIILLLVGVAVFGEKPKPSPNEAQRVSFANLKGKPAPDFSLPSYDGKTYKLSQFRGKKVMLFFNEGIMCYPACWNQVAALGQDPRFNNDGVAAFSIVPDERREWVQAVRKMPELAQATILLDFGTAVSAKYDTLNLDSSMHRGSKPGHTYVLVDAKGIIRYTKDDAGMGIHDDELAQELSKI